MRNKYFRPHFYLIRCLHKRYFHWLPKAAFVDILGMRAIYIPSSFLPSQFYRPIGLGLPTRILSHKKDVYRPMQAYRPTNQNLIPPEGCLSAYIGLQAYQPEFYLSRRMFGDHCEGIQGAGALYTGAVSTGEVPKCMILYIYSILYCKHA